MLLAGPLRRLTAVFAAGVAPLIAAPPLDAGALVVVDGSDCSLSWCRLPADFYGPGVHHSQRRVGDINKPWCLWHLETGLALEFLATKPMGATACIT